MTTSLLEHLAGRRHSGRKLLVPYLMAGIPDAAGFAECVAEVAPLADAIEVGLPFSDPLMDGPVIASAGERALRSGVGPRAALQLVGQAREVSAPRIVMTYYNPIHRMGEAAFCSAAAAAGVGGLIVPDLPLEESAELRKNAARHDLAWVPLIAPTSSPERVKALTETCTGFVYAVSALGVTGVRSNLSERARKVVDACRSATDLPVLVGIGVSTPQHAIEATRGADGVVIGSAVVGRLMQDGVSAAVTFVRAVRDALDAHAQS